MKKPSANQIKQRALLSIALFTSGMILFAQPRLTIYNETGKNISSQNLIVKSAAFVNLATGKTSIDAGLQYDFMSINKKSFTGFSVCSSKSFSLKGTPLSINGFFIQTRPTNILNETNWGALLKLRHNHFEMTLGTNFRTLIINKKAISEFTVSNYDSRIHEVYNLMYSFSYYLKPTDEKWNAGLSLTNIDNFVIHQETNPFITVNGFYNFNSKVALNAQACYKLSGISNLEVNHFGFYLRTGITWKFN
jgi:hypothetical protein